MPRPVRIGQLHGLHHEMQAVGSVVAILCQGVALQNIQHLDQMHPTR